MTFNRLLRLMASSVGLRFAGAGVGFVTQFVLTRSFGQAEVGVIFLAMAMASVFSHVVAMGYPFLALTQLPRFFALKVDGLVRATHGAFLRDMLGAATVVFLSVAVLYFFLPLSDGGRLAMVVGAFSALPSALIRYNASLANSLRRFQWAFIPDFIIRPCLFLLFVVGAIVIGFPLSIPNVLEGFVGCMILVAVLQAYVVRDWRARWSDMALARGRLTRVLRQRALALAFVGAVTMMFADIVTLLGGLFLSHEDLAVLGLAVRLAAISGFVVQATQQFVLPDLTEALTTKNTAQADALLFRLNLVTLVVLAVGIAGAIILGGWVMALFGEPYRRGHWLLVMLLMGQAIRALGGMNQNLLSIGGYQVQSVWAWMAGLVILIGVWDLLSTSLGLYAAGVAVIAAEPAWALMLAAQAQQYLRRRADFFWVTTGR